MTLATAVALHARALLGFDDRLAAAVGRLEQAAQVHAGRIVQATSLGAEDMVVTELIARHGLGIAVATLDTGRLHEETLALIPRIEARYGVTVQRFQPQAAEVLQFVQNHGEQAMFQSIALRKNCCGLRKLEPLQRLLAGRTAWVTGLRREQSGGRGQLPFTDTDDGGREKINPLAEWSWPDVWHFIERFDVPYNALHDQFFPSIGCAPCTRAVALGEDLRAGRWWWESETAKECGLHSPRSAPAPAAGVSRSEAPGGLASAQAHIGPADVKDAPASGRSQSETAKECGLHVRSKAKEITT